MDWKIYYVSVAIATSSIAHAQLGPSRRICAPNDRNIECLKQNNADDTARRQDEINQYLQRNQNAADKRQAQEHEDKRKECLRRLGPYDSASLCPR
jgi:hypothetical protein